MTDGEVPELRFPGVTRRPSAEARAYVYMVLVAMLDNELGPGQEDGWMFGGIDLDADKQRLRTAIKLVMKDLKRKAQGRR
jgi:hypothetical protein